MSNNLNTLFKLVKLPQAPFQEYLEKMRSFTKINLTNSEIPSIPVTYRKVELYEAPSYSELSHEELFQNGQNNGIYFISKRSCP